MTNKPASPNLKSQSGMSLMSVLVGIGMLGIFARIVSDMGGQAMQSARILRAMNEMEDVRNVIRVKTSCSQTKAKNSGQSSLMLYDKKGVPIAPNDKAVMKFDKWQVKVVSFNASNGAFVIVADHPDRQGGFKDLFQVAPFTCK